MLIGQANSIDTVTAQADGQILIGAANDDPSFVTPTAGAGLQVQSDAQTLQYSLQVPVSVANGGTGQATIAAYALVAGGATNNSALQALADSGNVGDVLRSNGSNALPSWQSLSQQSSQPYTNSFGSLETLQYQSVIQLQFGYNVSPDYVNMMLVGSGQIVAGSNLATLQTGITSNSNVLMQSKMLWPYKNGQGCKVIFSGMYSAGVNGFQITGVGSLQDGFFFGYNASSFGIMYRKGGIDTWVAQSTWNVDSLNGAGSSGITLDPTKGNLYQIQFEYLDFGVINFFVQNPSTGIMILVHQIKNGNANSATAFLTTLGLQLMAQVLNNASVANVVLKIGSMGLFVERMASQMDVRNCITSTKRITVDNTNILTIMNNSVYQLKQNQIMVYPDLLNVFNANAAVATFTLYLNPVVAGPVSYVNINPVITTPSVVSYDVSGTTVTAGKQLLSFFLPVNGYTTINLKDYGIFLAPGDRLVISCATGVSNVTLYAALSWLERF